MASKRLKGRYFIWHFSSQRMCHGKILGRLTDVGECDVFLLELFPLKDGLTHQSAVDLEIIVNTAAFELYETEAQCRAAFERQSGSDAHVEEARRRLN